MSTPPLSERKHAIGLQIYSGLGPQPFLLSTRMGSHSLLMVDVKVYYSQRYGFTPSANGGCQSLLQSTSMGSHPLLMVDVKVSSTQQK